MKREYTDAEAAELVRTVRVARASPRGPAVGRVWFVMMVVSLTALAVGMVVIAKMTVSQAGAAWPIPVLAVVAFGASYVGAILTRRRFKRRVLARDGRVCPNCHYDLAHEERQGETAFCPECREPYRPADLRRMWAAWSPGMVWWD